MRRKQGKLLLWTVGVFAILAVVSEIRGTRLDIQIGDTYFVISDSYVFSVPASFVLILWILYRLSDKVLYSKSLKLSHILITIITLMILTGSLFVDGHMQTPASMGVEFSKWNLYVDGGEYIHFVRPVIFVFLFGQIIFVINLIAGLVSRYSRRDVNAGRMSKD